MYFKILIFLFLPLFLYSEEKVENINIGYHNGISADAKYKNSRSALNIWVKDFAKNMYKNVNVKVHDDEKSVINGYITKKLDVVPISPYNYLNHKEEIDENIIDYLLLKKSKDDLFDKMYLIVNKKSNINTISDLKDKKIKR